MDSIGNYFKQLREYKQLSITEVAYKSKIRPNIIEDIENNNLHELFESGHLKMFIISLGKFYEADELSISKILELADRKFHIAEHSKIKVIEHVSEKKFFISSNAFYSVLLLIFVVGISCLIIHFQRQGRLNFDFIRNELITKKNTIEEKKVDNQIIKKDTIWAKQQLALDKKKQVVVNKNNVIDNVKVFYDTTDYVSDIIFKNQYSDLNPEL
ncbi:MAG TPA: helix-turn-helix domain-containing protein [Candidatus Cloacimonadota bacterium]|nr:helix-turn-helix domain-containing protein [Candidatus Cloacimonadota bacterium]HPK40666.1 helix-turn-helix domain-containing protein [Candidatus Cloacimonadota bacterium]